MSADTRCWANAPPCVRPRFLYEQGGKAFATKVGIQGSTIAQALAHVAKALRVEIVCVCVCVFSVLPDGFPKHSNTASTVALPFFYWTTCFSHPTPPDQTPQPIDNKPQAIHGVLTWPDSATVATSISKRRSSTRTDVYVQGRVHEGRVVISQQAVKRARDVWRRPFSLASMHQRLVESRPPRVKVLPTRGHRGILVRVLLLRHVGDPPSRSGREPLGGGTPLANTVARDSHSKARVKSLFFQRIMKRPRCAATLKDGVRRKRGVGTLTFVSCYERGIASSARSSASSSDSSSSVLPRGRFQQISTA